MIFLIAITCTTNYLVNYKIKKRMEEIRLCLVDFNDKEFTAKEVSWKVGTLGAWV